MGSLHDDENASDNRELSAFDDWQLFRRLGHRIVDDLASFLSTLRDNKAFTPLSSADLQIFAEPLPEHGTSAEATYERLRETVMPRLLGNIHPRYWGWADGSGLPLAALGELLAAAWNPNVEGLDHSAVYVEHQVVRWWNEIFGFPPDASGLLVSGTSTANLLALAVARHTATGGSVRHSGMRDQANIVFYASHQAHLSVLRAVELLGIGRDRLHVVDTHLDGAMNTEDLERLIVSDQRAGLTPACVVATVGTTTTGAVDDLNRIACIAQRHGLWMHVDGAFGALAQLVPSRAHLVAGVELATSIAFDLHKLLYLPFGVGCLLVRSSADHVETFAVRSGYLDGLPRPESGLSPFSSLGVETSRPFRALKVWLCLRAYGLRTFSAAIERNMMQAEHLRNRIREEPDLELIAPTPLNVVCFRWRSGSEMRDSQLNAVNRTILSRLQEDGSFILSGALLHDGTYVMRAAMMNHRTTIADVDDLLGAIQRIAPAAAALTSP